MLSDEAKASPDNEENVNTNAQLKVMIAPSYLKAEKASNDTEVDAGASESDDCDSSSSSEDEDASTDKKSRGSSSSSSSSSSSDSSSDSDSEDDFILDQCTVKVARPSESCYARAKDASSETSFEIPIVLPLSRYWPLHQIDESDELAVLEVTYRTQDDADMGRRPSRVCLHPYSPEPEDQEDVAEHTSLGQIAAYEAHAHALISCDREGGEQQNGMQTPKTTKATEDINNASLSISIEARDAPVYAEQAPTMTATTAEGKLQEMRCEEPQDSEPEPEDQGGQTEHQCRGSTMPMTENQKDIKIEQYAQALSEAKHVYEIDVGGWTSWKKFNSKHALSKVEDYPEKMKEASAFLYKMSEIRADVSGIQDDKSTDKSDDPEEGATSNGKSPSNDEIRPRLQAWFGTGGMELMGRLTDLEDRTSQMIKKFDLCIKVSTDSDGDVASAAETLKSAARKKREETVPNEDSRHGRASLSVEEAVGDTNSSQRASLKPTSSCEVQVVTHSQRVAVAASSTGPTRVSRLKTGAQPTVAPQLAKCSVPAPAATLVASTTVPHSPSPPASVPPASESIKFKHPAQPNFTSARLACSHMRPQSSSSNTVGALATRPGCKSPPVVTRRIVTLRRLTTF